MDRDNGESYAAQLARMVARGVLTEQEAARLAKSLDGVPVPGQSVPRRGRRLTLLLGTCLLFALLALLAGYLLTTPEPSAGVAAGVEQSRAAETVDPQRPVDLQTITEERRNTMAKVTNLSAAVAVVVIAALVAGLLMWFYNRLVDSREAVNAGWAQVENTYQRRLDLVPLLIDAVQTYVDHERETLEALVQARANAVAINRQFQTEPPQNAGQMQALEAAQGEVKQALGRLLAIVENYPDLQASRNFLALQDQVEGTENRIAQERRHYNELVRDYNARLLKFPSNLVAGMLDFSDKPYFAAEDRALEGLEDPFNRQGNRD